MILALTLALAVAQSTSATPQTVLRPSQAGKQTHEVCDMVEAAMASSDWAKAERLTGLFPKETVVYQWDDSKVPEGARSLYDDAKKAALNIWRNRFNHVAFEEGPKPDIKFSFVPQLPDDPEAKMPASVVTFLATDPTATRLEAVFSIKRGKKLQDCSDVDVYNDVLYSVGLYLGLGPGPSVGSAMGHQAAPSQIKNEITTRESSGAFEIYELARTYRDAIKAKKVLKNLAPSFFTDTTALELGTTTQGSVVPATVQISNTGAGVMTYSMAPDCGCMRTSPPGTLKPGESTLLRADFDSRQYVGDLNKRIFLMTNDPDKRFLTIPVHIVVVPNYRFIRPEGNVLVMNGKRGHAELFLCLADKSDIIPTEYRIEGIPGVAQAEDWTGTLADPDLNEGPKPRHGFKISMDIEGVLPPGRSSATLIVKTSSPSFETLRYNIYLQNGIVALPSRLYLGNMATLKKTTTFLVSRPGKPFKVVKVEASSPNLSVKTTPNAAKDEYRVEVAYDGNAPSGEFLHTITVTTDDPKQKTLEISVGGRVE